MEVGPPPPSTQQDEKGRENRTEYRVPIAREGLIDARLWRLRGDEPLPLEPPEDLIPAVLLNMSAGGAAIRLNVIEHGPLATGDLVGLMLQRPATDVRFIMQAEIRHQQMVDTESCTAGMRFIFDPASAADNRLRRQIEALLAQLQRQQLQRRAKYLGGDA